MSRSIGGRLEVKSKVVVIDEMNGSGGSLGRHK